ncbi:DUF2461 domain-containing protein [Longispora albida]|uniref:DUF2461 domain-containing protein n=1 Tax=Longispora albida TaxID=203523 RepID=UPI00035F529D|nr:DUF2461 domain-containing protein [Longispora albida]
MAGGTGFSAGTFAFYEGLLADNSKAYWAAHKDEYESAVREPMRALLDRLAPSFGGGSVVMFRPYRDIRFSADKSPYKLHQGGFVEMSPGVGYYLQIDADGVLIGAGFHARDRAQVASYRAAVDNTATGGQIAAITAKLEKDGFELGGEQVKTRPRGVPAGHPRLDLMRREYLTAGRSMPAGDVLAAEDFGGVVAAGWTKLRPLVEWVVASV